jgi:hypothetical protein
VTEDELLNEVMVLRRALCDVQEYNIDWRLGTAENMDKVQAMAYEALNRPIPAIDRRTPTAPPEPPTETWCQRCDGLVTDAPVVEYAGTTPPPLCRCAGPRRKTPTATPGTAPTPPSEPCSTCKGSGEVLFLYQRGPGDPPGNQMIACPMCRAGTPRGDE